MNESRIARMARAYLHARELARQWHNAEQEAFQSLKQELKIRNRPIVIDGVYISFEGEGNLLTRPVEVVS